MEIDPTLVGGRLEAFERGGIGSVPHAIDQRRAPATPGGQELAS